MSSNRPFKPKFAVKVKKFSSRYVFGPARDDGPRVPLSVDFDIDVRAIGILNAREKVSMQFSDYEYVGD